MRKVFFTLAAIMVVAAGAAWYFIAFRLDSTVESRIERAATLALGSAVEVGGVHTNLRDGTLIVDKISIANPPGFKSLYAVHLNAAKAAVDYARLEIKQLVIEDPEFIIEEVGGKTNFDRMMEALDSGPEQGPVGVSGTDSGQGEGRVPKAEPVIIVRHFRINETRAMFESKSLDTVSDVEIDAIEMNDLRGTPSELAEQIGRKVLDKLSSEAARELLKGQAKRQLKKIGGSMSGALHGLLGDGDKESDAEGEVDSGGDDDSGN